MKIFVVKIVPHIAQPAGSMSPEAIDVKPILCSSRNNLCIYRQLHIHIFPPFLIHERECKGSI